MEVIGGMSNNNPKKVWKWLKTMPSLSELREKYPEEWTIVQRDISKAPESLLEFRNDFT